jgi:hypothetical protein
MSKVEEELGFFRFTSDRLHSAMGVLITLWIGLTDDTTPVPFLSYVSLSYTNIVMAPKADTLMYT